MTRFLKMMKITIFFLMEMYFIHKEKILQYVPCKTQPGLQCMRSSTKNTDQATYMAAESMFVSNVTTWSMLMCL